jgi:hypothetical protein
MRQEKKYSTIGAGLNGILGSITGSFMGSIEGGIGSLAVLTSLRKMHSNLDQNIDETFGDQTPDIYDQICNAVYHTTRIPLRLGIHSTVLERAFDNLGEVVSGNIEEVDWALVLIPNAISLCYEIYRRGYRNSIDHESN